MNTYLDFEKPLADLDRKIAELENLSGNGEGPSLQDEISRLREKSSKQLHELYKNLDPWRKTQVARHPERPHFKDYIAEAFEDFVPLAGDRVFGEDEAIVGGLAKFRGRSVVVMGHEKGRSTEGRIKHNFGMAHPEGYRKAEVTLGGVDTAGLSSKTMGALAVPGLFFIGEAVDVTGPLGGYNFQWAWASGYAAGQYV